MYAVQRECGFRPFLYAARRVLHAPALSIRRPAARAAYDHPMADDDRPAWAAAAGAVLLGAFAVALLLIAADVITGGKLTGRKGCGCGDDDQPGD